MSELQIKMCLAHDLIDVYWTSIEVRGGLSNYKYFCESRFLPGLQELVQCLGATSQEDSKLQDLVTVYNTFCRQWDLLFKDKDCWNSPVIHNTNLHYYKMYKIMKELVTDLRLLAYQMKPMSAFSE